MIDRRPADAAPLPRSSRGITVAIVARIRRSREGPPVQRPAGPPKATP